MDGEITIGTRLDTDKFDRQISDLEKKMKKEEDKKIVIDAKLGSQQQELDKARQKTDALADAYQRLNELQDRLATGQATPKEFTTFQDLQNTYGSLEQIGTQFDKALSKQNAIEQKVAQTKYRYDEINAKVSEYKQKIENVKIQRQVADVEQLKQGFNNVGNSLESSIKKVARLALGIFGIRSAFMFLKRASSDLASYDQQYATNLEYIRYALTQMIAPVLQWIVNLAAKLLGYINAIMQAWFGINIFSRGSAESFNKMKAGASGVSKAVKEIKKQLAGFDEINMLTDQSDTGTSAGAGGVGMPSFDLSAMQGEVPDWLQWIVDHKDEILSTLAGIAAGLVAIKFGLGGIKALGIGILVKGIIDLISSLRDYLKDPSWENFGKVIKAIGEIILGLGIIIGNVPLIVAGAIAVILGLLAKNWEKIKQGFDNAVNWISSLGDKLWQWFFKNINNISEKFGWLGLGIVSTFIMAFDWITKLVAGIVQMIRNLLDGLFVGLKQIIDGIIQMFRGDLSSGIISIVKGIANMIIGIINSLTAGINAIAYPIRALIAGIGAVTGKGWSINSVSIPRIPRLKSGAIVNMPNRGTLVAGGSAIAGEAGHEGIIPLDDNQAMAQLGAEIGRNVVVNLTNITKVGNRQIAREIKQINAEQEFAFNS